MRIIIFLGLILTISGCNRRAETEPMSPSECSTYFEFDQVDYYSVDISEDSVFTLEEKEGKATNELRLLELLLQDTLNELNDTIKLKDFETVGFAKQEISQDKFGQLDQIFCERTHDETVYSTCIPVYRDILFFKRKRRTIGFARICFDCDNSIIAGTTRDVSQFGQSGDYGRLWRLLKH